jgi:hypothetical protein
VIRIQPDNRRFTLESCPQWARWSAAPMADGWSGHRHAARAGTGSHRAGYLSITGLADVVVKQPEPAVGVMPCCMHHLWMPAVIF